MATALSINDTNKSNIIQFPIQPIQKEKTQPIKKYSKETGSESVQPLTSLEDVQKSKDYFLNRPQRYKNSNLNIRDYTIFVFGINMARRCGDLLHLRLHNVLDCNLNIKTHICITEQKTGKSAKVPINEPMIDALNLYLSTLDFEDIIRTDYLFKSRQGGNQPMTVDNFYKKMQGLRDELSIADPIGTHTLRKTWAYLTVKNNLDNPYIVAEVSEALGHSCEKITRRYLGLTQKKMDKLFMDNAL